jgi:hypothetical protein
MLKHYKKQAQAYAHTFMGSDQQPHTNAQIILQDLAHKSGAMLNGGAKQLTSFVPNDPYMTAFNEGKRYMFNYLLTRLRLNPYHLNQLTNEDIYGHSSDHNE